MKHKDKRYVLKNKKGHHTKKRPFVVQCRRVPLPFHLEPTEDGFQVVRPHTSEHPKPSQIRLPESVARLSCPTCQRAWYVDAFYLETLGVLYNLFESLAHKRVATALRHEACGTPMNLCLLETGVDFQEEEEYPNPNPGMSP
jgi:hypothetical protein